MSRAIAINASVAEVTDYCAKQDLGISVIEPLTSGGTRVVLNNVPDTEALRRGMKARVIETPVVRSSLYVCRMPKSYL
ncbi:hypothetical protein SLG_07130 [Sphingobium sp. SYK-6]|uniref:hypothetical protein n=1 Tax=Sphingobium sp. (strain NBRC 103272 / SYK-6) TaxID=627192 RepID=UPI00022769B5|nr:hypothetical protein [Sphingobium sp. SYK-6]BAK65388.1 hypothetical protein SLG_07130 [Sphingobium sp. SYK-6]